MLALTILGNNSALSMHDRHQTAQVVTSDDQLFLIDCGESTQNQLHRYKVRKSKINHIFISHLHGDHYYGLAGLLNTYSLTNRKDPLHLYATPILKDIIDLQMKASASEFNFEFHFHPITEAATILDLPGIKVSCFPVTHKIPCWGFLFQEKEKPRKIDVALAEKKGIKRDQFKDLKEGKDVQNETGEWVRYLDVTSRSSAPKTYAFCADTRYEENIIPFIQNADLIYHESTYLDDQIEKAQQRFHSTSTQAATIATKASVKRMLLGHFSSKYEDTSEFLKQAKQTFENTEISKEGVTYII